jgi:hypothetical protein
MEEVAYEHREHQETNKDGSIVKVTTVVRVQKKKVLTNPDIEARKRLKKFGQVAGQEKGEIEGMIQLDDKDIYLLPFGQEKNEETITKFVSNRTHRERMEALKKKEEEIKTGRVDDGRVRQLYSSDSTQFSIKVSNLPLGLTQQEIEDFFAHPVRPKKIYRPMGREDNRPRDFAYVHFVTKGEAAEAINRYNGKVCGCQVLMAEWADSNRNAPGRAPVKRPGKK